MQKRHAFFWLSPLKNPRVCCWNVCGLPKSRNVWCKLFSSLERVKLYDYYYYYYGETYGHGLEVVGSWRRTLVLASWLSPRHSFWQGSASGDKKIYMLYKRILKKGTKKCKNHLINVAEQHDPAWCVLALVTWLLICVSPVHVPVTQ